jgi:hypothetical protein
MLDFFRRLRGPRLPRIIRLVDPKRLWTVARLAQEWCVTHQAIHDRIERGTLVPHYIAETSGKRSIYLFDPEQIESEMPVGL